MATADDKDCKHYFHMPELKHSVVDSHQSVAAQVNGMRSRKGHHFGQLLN